MGRPFGSKSKIPRNEFFYSKLSKPTRNGCLNWTGCKFKFGYGRIIVNGKSKLAHRYSYELHNNIILKKEQCILHSCDNPKCVAPYHLRIGSREENNLERDQKGRHTAQKGERNYFHKLTLKQVKEIKKLIKEGVKRGIAKKYNVSNTCIAEIRRGITWKDA